MHVCIIAYKRLVTGPRVLRQARTFRNLGWDVTLVGFMRPGDTGEGNILPLEEIQPKRSWTIPQALERGVLSAEMAWRLHPQNRAARAKLREFQAHVDYIIAHDWECAPLAHELAERRGIPFGIDVHEYAREEFCPTGHWLRDFLGKYVHDRHADAIQRRYFPLAAGITTVCDGIADLLQRDYGLARRPGVARSVPFYQECAFRPCAERIRVLYHGAIDYSRQLDVLIRAIPLLDKSYVVEIRGPANEEYLEGLKTLAGSLGVENRVDFTSPVPFSQIIPEANKADIGYEVLNDYSPQHRFMLPNKFFENTMAGLALCVSAFPEMKKVVNTYKHGVCVDDCSPEAVAKVLNALTREQINEMKLASLQAAKELCWEKEEKKMLTAYGVV